MFGASVELRLMPCTGGSMEVERRFKGEGRCRNWEISSPVRTLRRGAPADKVGLESSGIGDGLEIFLEWGKTWGRWG